jgi:hypothetical protein
MTDRRAPVPLPESTHPYAVRVSLVLGTNVELNMTEDEVCLPFTDDYTIRIVKEHANPREQAASLKRVTVDLEAFPSACEAERAGKLLTASVLWVAASKRVTIAFERRTGDFPFAVRDRTQSTGSSLRAEGRVHFNIMPEEFSSAAGGAYKLGIDVAPHVLTSMEFYASARMESTERARFIGLMTALEALSEQRDYGDEVARLLGELASRLEESPLLAGEGKAALRSSLSSRLKQLRQESVRQAIVRIVREHGGEQGTVRFVDEAYGVRSKILHEGFRASELHTLTDRLEDVMRQIYSAVLGLPLDRPVYPT